MDIQLLQEITPKSMLKAEGNKAGQLQKLIQHKFRCPTSWVIGSDVYDSYLAGTDIKLALLAAFKQKLDPNKLYAIRSSSNIEDSKDFSFAGLFKTVLNVQGDLNILTAVETIWQSASSPDVKAYVERLEVHTQDLKMSVLIQEMVRPVISGVLFSQNPMTGSKEIVIEAIQGLGTQLVQDGVTPERYVYRSDGWIAKPDRSTIPLSVIEQVLEDAKKIIQTFRRPLDFEWVYDGEHVYWVQMREISTINTVKVYSNRFSKDMMPGMIHPLIWSINIPLINSVWIGLLEEMVGKSGIKPEDLAKSFYYRSYFDMGTMGKIFNKVGFPSEGLEMMMGMLPQQKGRPVYRPSFKSMLLVPRLVKFMHSKWNFEKRLLKDLPQIEQDLQSYKLDQIQTASWQQVSTSIEALYKTVQKSVYLNILAPILASMYTRMLEKQLMKNDYKLSDLDLTQNIPEMDKYNPSHALQKLNTALSQLQPQDKNAFDTNDLDQIRSHYAFQHFMELFDAFIERFGHLSENSNNFIAVPWREQPEMVLDMLKNHTVPSHSGTSSISFSEIKLNPLKKSMLNLLYKRVRNYTYYREKVSRAYTYGYGLFRPYFLRLASIMQQKGWLEEPNQIFFLSWQEIKQALSDDSGETLIETIKKRQQEMTYYEDLKLPDVIYGDEAPPVFPTAFSRLEGTPTSPGYYAGPVRRITGFKDFSKVRHGDVVVIPYSDVGWSSIFSKAGAVIAESGGMLSHSSIIAREYKIPAVVSVSNALSLIDDQEVSVNGYTGEIVILEN